MNYANVASVNKSNTNRFVKMSVLFSVAPTFSTIQTNAFCDFLFEPILRFGKTSQSSSHLHRFSSLKTCATVLSS